MSLYFIPALVSLLLKLVVLTHALRGRKVSILFLSLITVFAIHNAIETIGYLLFFNGNYDIANAFLDLYYVATIFLLFYILLHAITVSSLDNPYITATLTLITTTISVLVLFTDTIVAGQTIIGNYSITAVKGSLYWLFSSFVVIFLISTLLILIYGYKTHKSELEVARCKYSLLALMPVMSVSLLVVILKTLEVKVNGAGLIPIATTLFLIIVLQTESKHKLSSIRRFLPLSMERQTTSKFLSLLDNYLQNSNQENIYKDLQKSIEKEIISYSLKKCNYNVAHTAKMMGIRNRSTLYAMINRHNIDLERTKITETDLKNNNANHLG